MAKRDPDKSARNRIIQRLKDELQQKLPDVLKATKLRNEMSLNAKIGSKHDDYFDLKNDVIHSDAEFTNKWLAGVKKHAKDDNSHDWILKNLKKHTSFKEYLLLFLKKSYLKHYDELSKRRPNLNQTEIWIGQENANYGLLVTPRFVDGEWENDSSEVRAFSQGYWTIGHVLKTGLVVPHRDAKIEFKDVNQYLNFFAHTLVRNSGSKYEYEIAELYCNFVKASNDPLNVPLMIPEFRYLGITKKHKYRLDFLITNPYTLERIGFELSPWSTHGYLKKIGNLTQAQINEMAKDNFENEMDKHRDYFRKHDIYSLIYTDRQLRDCKKMFNEEIMPHLEPEKPSTQISFSIIEEFLE